MMNKYLQSSIVSSRSRGAFEIALLYLLIGSLWIVFSDEAAARLAPNQAVLTQISIYKGWGYVLVTALLLYWMIRLHTRRISETEWTLSENERNYQELLQQASDGIFIADAKGNYTLVNEEACRLVGYTKEELLSMNLRELIAPEDIQKTPPRLDELKNGKTLLSERILLRKGGSRILCEISAKQLADGRYQSIVRDITERKVAETALWRSEQRYRSLFENMTNGFARCQILYAKNGVPNDFIYLDVNQTFEKMTGLKNVLGKRVSAVIPGIRESNPELFEIYGRVALTGKPEKFETYVPGLESGIWFSVSVYSTEKDFFGAVFETITERKQAEIALRENEERLRLSLHAANQGLYDLNVQTGDTIINREYAEMLGYEPDSFIETNAAWIERLHPDDREITANAYADYIKGVTSEYRVEFRQKTKDGGWKWILSLGKVAEYDATGKPLRMLGTHTDITERKQVEAASQKSEKRFREIFENTNDAIYIWSLGEDGTIAKGAEVNDVACKRMGYSKEEFLQLSPVDINVGNIREKLPHMIAPLLSHGQMFTEVLHRTKDGRNIPVEISSRIVELMGEKKIISLVRDITERKQAEDALQKSQTQLQAIMDYSPALISIKDLNGNIVLANRSFAALDAPPLNEFIGQNVFDIFPKEVAEQLWNNDLAALQANAPVRSEEVVKHKDGAWHTYLTVKFPIYLKSDQPIGICAISNDITERKQVEEKILDSELRYRRLFESAKDGILILDADTGMVVDVNPFLIKMLGYSHDVFLGKAIWELGFFKDIVANKDNFLELQQKEYIRYEDLPLETVNGKRIHVEFISNVYQVDRHKVIQCNIRDITERKQMEEQVRAHSVRLKILADASGIFAIVVQDYQAALDQVVNQVVTVLADMCQIRLLSSDGQSLEFASIYSLDPELTESLRSLEFNKASKLNDDPNLAFQVLRSGKPAFVPVITADQLRASVPPEYWAIYQRYAPHSYMIVPLSVRGHVIGVMSLTRYRNDQPAFTKEDLELAQDLASRAALTLNGARLFQQVQAELTERKHAEEELKRSNAELEQFAYVASHDLQEPLRAVAGMVQLLGQRYQGKLDERADEYIGHAVDAATRMQTLINDLLDYSRVNRLGRTFENTAVERSLNTALANLQAAIQESQAHITHDPLPSLSADSSQLTQVLQNLIGNAIKFRGAEPLHIHIGAKKIEHAWQFSVSDNGIGIESKYFERIFLVFQRLHTRREYPGTGIGLALCKKIIERHGGQIWVESQPGLGSTFYFTIPERQP